MKRSSLAFHERRIAKMLGRALAAALAAPAALVGAQACSSDETTTSDAGVDASTDLVDAGACAPYVTERVDATTAGGCTYTSEIERLPCGAPPGLVVYDDCYFRLADCAQLCVGPVVSNCHYSSPNCDGGVIDDGGDGDAGDTLIECQTSAPCGGKGRRPEGLLPSRRRGSRDASRIAGWLAAATHLEAASVHAFRIMKRELAELGAPEDIVRAAERARRDEIRHAKMTARLAKLHGGSPARARVGKQRPRTLEAIAVENVVEGCVRETFGALLARWQAEHAHDERIASLMKEIAVDEARHAALAWSVAAWAESTLDAAANGRVQAAKAKALRDLEGELAQEPPPELVTFAGLPSAAIQKTMLAALFAA